jgi:hypothetical protein
MSGSEAKFDELARAVATSRSRRDVVRVGVGLAAASVAALFPARAAANQKPEKALRKCHKFCEDAFDPGPAQDRCKNEFCVTGGTSSGCPPGRQPVCACTPVTCTPPKTQNPTTCACECPPCPGGQKPVDPNTCRCACDPPLVCGPGQVPDELNCACVTVCPDAGEACDTGQPGRCATGVIVCTEDGEQVCQPVLGPIPEICGNGIDDDCDGIVDEGCP